MDKENATQQSQSSVQDIKQSDTSKTKPPFKIELCLTELVKRGEQGMVELEALQAYGETCLHTTISTLANKHLLIIRRIPEPHQHRHGGTTTFTRYSLVHPGSIVKAKVLLSQYQERRKAA